MGNQKYRPIELRVVDDSGEKHSTSVVDTPYLEDGRDLVSVRYQAALLNEGPHITRQIDLDDPHGECVQILDDVDFLNPEVIEMRLAIFVNLENGGPHIRGFNVMIARPGYPRVKGKWKSLINPSDSI